VRLASSSSGIALCACVLVLGTAPREWSLHFFKEFLYSCECS
jgi:hypothetical protein